MPALTLDEFLKLLPNVARARARELVGDGLSLFFENGKFKDEITLNGCTVHREDLTSLSVFKRVDVPAADAIIRLYKADALPMSYGKRPGPCPDAEAYLERARYAAAQRIAEKSQQTELNEAEREAYKLKIANPSSIPEEEFTLALLNDVFFKHNGPGAGALEIGGIKVTKSRPVRYESNSGRSADWAYTYTWTSADGTPRSISHESSFSDNRRNDADRNWGLGPE